MSDETPAPPSSDAVAAAQQIPPPPPPAAEPEAELADLPEDQDTFPRSYVEKQRNENAKWRTRTRDIESHFDGYSPEERTRFLDMAAQLTTDPEAALVEYEGVTNRLRKQLGKDTPVPEEAAPPAPAAEVPAPPAAAEDVATQVDRLVSERLEVERAAQAKDDGVQATLREAEALDDRYKDPAAKAHLFAVAQQNQSDLATAHEFITGGIQSQIDAAVEARLADLASGRAHPPRIPAGDPTAASSSGPPKTLAEARAAAEARMDAAYGTQ